MAASKEEKKEKVSKKSEDKNIEKIKNPDGVKRKKSKKTLLIAIILVILIIFAIFFSSIFALTQRYKGTIASGITIRGIDISNLTVAESSKKIADTLMKEIKTPLKLKYGDYTLDVNVSDIEFEYKLDDALAIALGVGRDENIVKGNYDIILAKLKGKEIELGYKYNEQVLNQIIENASSAIPGKTTEYTYCIDGEELIITPGVDGVVVDTEALKKLILNSIVNRDSSFENKEVQELEIPVIQKKADSINIEKIYNEVHCEPIDAVLIEEPFELKKDEDGIDFDISIDEAKAMLAEPKDEYTIPLKISKANVTIASLGEKAFPQLLSTYSTNYNAGYIARSKNLEIAASKINGTVLMPGEEFSFNKVVGKRTVQDGYQNAPVYENGKVVDGLAGGICQISSTLYNAALLANLEITDRRNHNFVSTYVPEGRDATVVYGSTDFKFKNSRNYPIRLTCSVSGGVARFDIKGIEEETEYDVKIVTSVIGSTPFAEELEVDDSLEPGTKIVSQAGHNGLRVNSYRVLYLNGEEVSRTLLATDTYRVMNRIVRVSPETIEEQEDGETDSNLPEDLEGTPTNNNTPTETTPTDIVPTNSTQTVEKPEENEVKTDNNNQEAPEKTEPSNEKADNQTKPEEKTTPEKEPEAKPETIEINTEPDASEPNEAEDDGESQESSEEPEEETEEN